MSPIPHLTRSSLVARSLAALSFLGGWAEVGSEAAVTAGGIAVVGFTDTRFFSGDPLEDTFSIAALEEIIAGTTLYFTNNGWSQTNGTFFGAGEGGGQGPGAEQLLKLTFTSNVAAGTIMQSGVDDTGYEWDVSGTILNTFDAPIGQYSLLNLPDNGDGDQIYVFEASAKAPLFNPTNHIFMLDTGTDVANDFEDGVDSYTGHLPPGLDPVDNTAFILSDPGPGDDPFDFHNGSFALDMAHPDVAALQLSGGTMAQWLALIVDDSKWLRINEGGMTDPDAESQLTSLNVIGVPEPSRTLLLGLGLALSSLRRRRGR
jgi:hypothetical protein